MRELSHKEHKVQSALGTLSMYRVTVAIVEGRKSIVLCTTPIRASNLVDALHKVWKRKRK